MLKKNIFIHRFFFIFTLSFFILCVFSLKCFAVDFTIGDNVLSFGDLPTEVENFEYWVLIRDRDVDPYYSLYCSDSPITFDNNNSCLHGTNLTRYCARLGAGWRKLAWECSSYGLPDSNYVFTITNHNIMDYNNSSETFFQKPPLVVQLMEITQVEEIPKVIAEVLKLIIPIGLVVLSVVLIIYLVRLVILRVT